MVSVVAALSYRNDNFDLYGQQLIQSISSPPTIYLHRNQDPPSSLLSTTATTHFSATLRYANVGVNRSAAMEVVNGSRFGAYWLFLVLATTSRAVSGDGTIVT